MNRNDVHTPNGPDNRQLSARHADCLSGIIDTATDFDRAANQALAGRTTMIDRARRFVESVYFRRLPNGPAGVGISGSIGWDPSTVAHKVLISELACRLRLPEATVSKLVVEARLIVQDLPLTFAALQSGDLSYRHAASIADHAGSLPPEARAGFEIPLIGPATTLTVAKLDNKARKLRELFHPETITARHNKSLQDRQVVFTPDRDGMAWINAHVSADVADGIYNRLTDIAETLQHPDETRTLMQLRTDVFTDLLSDGEIPIEEFTSDTVHSYDEIPIDNGPFTIPIDHVAADHLPEEDPAGEDPAGQELTVDGRLYDKHLFDETPFAGTPFEGTPFAGTQFEGTPFAGTQFDAVPTDDNLSDLDQLVDPIGDSFVETLAWMNELLPHTPHLDDDLSRRERRTKSRNKNPKRRNSRGIRPTVMVTVPVMTLLGASETPGNLEGYGPIDPDTARKLAAHAPSFIRLLTDPETGTILSIGRHRHRVPTDLQQFLRVRDETCRFPGCNKPAHRCDIDHVHNWEHGGPTAHNNLAHLCEKHHNLKHQTDWTLTLHPNGDTTWTSPTNQTYTTHPETPLHTPPHPQNPST